MADGSAPHEGPGSAEPQSPPDSFVEQAAVSDPDVYEEFERDWPACWNRAAALLDWETDYGAVLEEGDTVDWFPGGRLNASYNCVDRHVEAGRGDAVALEWEGKLDETRTYTYRELYEEVNAFAAALRDLGVGENDVVTLYMPVLPDLVVSMLACARIGAPHSVVFAGFSADALATRMQNTGSRLLVTCDGYYRRGDAVDLKSTADNACLSVSREVEQVVVDRLGAGDYPGDHHSYADCIAAHEGAVVEPVPRGASDLLFYIYTSGTTGEPTAVRHTTGGYLAHVAWTTHAVLDLDHTDTYWCTADVGWITGHSYVVYGPLALGATTVLYEGTPDPPEKDRFWEILERHEVDVFYTAPTSIRAFVKWGADHPASHDLSSLRLLGTVGESIDETAWKWYRDHIGGGTCPIVDTWWQTETGGMMVSTLPGVDEMRPGSVGRPLPGIEVAVVDEFGERVEPGESGQLVVTRPWPGQPASLCEGTGWARRQLATGDAAPDGSDWCYRTGDGAVASEDGYITVLGRLDDVVTVAGQRLGTAEIESAIVAVDGVAEAAVVGGRNDHGETTVHAYVSPAANVAGTESLHERICDGVEETIGPVGVPDEVTFTAALPKTRSGKILRRYLEAIANGETPGDASSLRNPEVVGELASRGEE
ncbi:acetate--CoA ligase [Haloarchaeobius sp. TZWWS8]|uniref:acetate--CoA ligase n=1 Tax=Haloarchaeobius sp. TZWWS8 TaxID=3446121 RepID=UPI003EB854C3